MLEGNPRQVQGKKESTLQQRRKRTVKMTLGDICLQDLATRGWEVS